MKDCGFRIGSIAQAWPYQTKVEIRNPKSETSTNEDRGNEGNEANDECLSSNAEGMAKCRMADPPAARLHFCMVVAKSLGFQISDFKFQTPARQASAGRDMSLLL